MTVTILAGDARAVLATLPAGCIDLTVTSPPYDNLRRYGGYSFDFEAIAAELYRVTKPGGVVVWVVGDATVKGSETGTSFRQALHFKDIGFNLHDTMIYHRPGPPKQNRVRYEQHFEYMFVLSKGAVRIRNVLMEPCKHAGRMVPRTCRDSGKDALVVSAGVVADEKPRSNIWYYVPGASINKTTHPAVFPEQLAADHIASWSNPGDTVLDPFMGSGTTGKMAVLAERKFIGCDISPEYVALARGRIDAATPIPRLEAAD
jgi:DNA modification methylase